MVRSGASCALDTLKLLNQARYYVPVAREMSELGVRVGVAGGDAA